MAAQDVFVIGDVHGCLHTLEAVLQHWRPESEQLIQVGDLIDRGRYSPECVALAISLEVRHPGQTTFLKGNHEAAMLRHFGPAGPYAGWLRWGGRSTVQQYEACPALLEPHLAWLARRPLYWQSQHLLISHAGFADTPHQLDEDHPDGLLWRRGPLLNMGRRQVIGHTPTNGDPTYDPATNVLNIDTGACFGFALTGVRLAATGELLEEIIIHTHRADIAAE
ncbi:metallophosphoesterase [Hymenobacter psychrotolerans]|uniref:Serine/threonine protein phosphatase 1 n=1 Tax=Hymenobacter psychrotolerans DSM 18569 TaxID=1121959 RepID=A0A1M6Y773_9BACT|nr:metallophosphoesterase [Hymenobacter psychrotolerans]SHL14116.1 serine/threonine protein phosphatase 1 [Hymenobacter psychrotolerans DSM 18569]